MDKNALKTKLIELLGGDWKQASGEYRSYLADARVDRSEPAENDEVAQAGAAAEIAEALGEDAANEEQKAQRVAEIDFGPKSEVQEGAVVRIGRMNYIAAASTPEFTLDGEAYRGIGTASPLFRAMEGLVAGETFTFNGRKMKITAIA
jgi:hypothetical protein